MAVTKLEQNYGTGRRKEAVARVFLRPGSGQIMVNQKSLGDYFPRPTAQVLVRRPLVILGVQDRFDVVVTVSGGGCGGQAGAVCHGLARALLDYETDSDKTTDEMELSWRQALRAAGLVTRDAREVERKKYGRRKARRSVQYSKR